jgi:hypothetical protein
MVDRHHPRKRVAQYSRASGINRKVTEYWFARSKPGDDGNNKPLVNCLNRKSP